MPRAVLVVAIVLSLAAAIATVTGFSLLFPDPIWNRMWELNRPAYLAFSRFGRLSGVVLFALAIGTGAAALGMIGRKKWGWWAAVTLFAANGMGDLLALADAHDLARSGSGVLIAGLFLYLLMRPDVRAHFKSQLLT